MASARDYLGDTSRTQDLVLLAALGLATYVIYQIVQGAKKLPAAAAAATAPVANLAASIIVELQNEWHNMTGANMPLLGNVLWPDGTRTPLANLTVKQDALGNVYVSDGQGLLFQLQPSNAQGDWPALQITDPSQIGQAPAVGPISTLPTTVPFVGGATPGPWEGL